MQNTTFIAKEFYGINGLTAAFIDIQNLYVMEQKYGENINTPIISNQNLRGRITRGTNDSTYRIEFEKVVCSKELVNDKDLLIRPTFGGQAYHLSLREEMENFRFGVGADRPRSLLYRIDKLPIKKIEITHSIEDPDLKDLIEKAENSANFFFFQENLSFFDYLKSLVWY